MTSAEEVPDRRLRLPDGRQLGFCIYGNPGGTPVVFLHGTPGSRRQMAVAHEASKRLDIAFIAPDRWGYGLSEAPRAPTLSDYAGDVAALMTHLGHARFSVGGVSGGGPFAAAVAACCPPRVVSVALVSPVGPIADTDPALSLSPVHRFNFTVLPRHPRLVSTVFGIFGKILQHAPGLAARLSGLLAAPVDKPLIAKPEIADLILGSAREGLRAGTKGPRIDLATFSRPWGIDLAAIQGPSRVWFGSADRDVPLAAVRALAARIPGCILTELPDEGHFWVITHVEEVLQWLASARGAP